MDLTDFFPRSRTLHVTKIKNWLVRRLECRRGEADLEVEIFPAFNYARDRHGTQITRTGDKPDLQAKGSLEGSEDRQTVVFKSDGLGLQLDVIISYDSSSDEDQASRKERSDFQLRLSKSSLGEGVMASIHLMEGVGVSFILRDLSDDNLEQPTKGLIGGLQEDTLAYWNKWLSQCNYKGRFREVIERSLMILKLLTYEPTGAIIAAPTFSLPEDFGGSRNWDYRYSWIRDSSFTIYVLLRMGFTEEAEAYVNYVSDRIQHSRTKEGAMPIMFGIRKDSDLEEIELTHLDGYRGSKPVRIGNGASLHVQLDIYGELMDGFYLYNKYGKPISYDQWVAIRETTDYICGIWQEKDMSIWEVRGDKQNFVYSKIMLWVAFDRALRLAEKRCLPCPNRDRWLKIRDQIYEDIMEKGFNKKLNSFIQSYESTNVLDAAVLIAPLVFFIAPNDPRFIGTLNNILKAPERGGLTSTDLVYRYNTADSNDGIIPQPPPGISHVPDADDYRRRWPRRQLQHVHFLARRSPHPRKSYSHFPPSISSPSSNTHPSPTALPSPHPLAPKLILGAPKNRPENTKKNTSKKQPASSKTCSRSATTWACSPKRLLARESSWGIRRRRLVIWR